MDQKLQLNKIEKLKLHLTKKEKTKILALSFMTKDNQRN